MSKVRKRWEMREVEKELSRAETTWWKCPNHCFPAWGRSITKDRKDRCKEKSSWWSFCFANLALLGIFTSLLSFSLNYLSASDIWDIWDISGWLKKLSHWCRDLGKACVGSWCEQVNKAVALSTKEFCGILQNSKMSVLCIIDYIGYPTCTFSHSLGDKEQQFDWTWLCTITNCWYLQPSPTPWCRTINQV